MLDGDPDTAEMYAVGLRVFGFETVVADGVDDALERIRRQRPDAIVADAQAAMSDAWKLVTRVKLDAATRDIPVVVLTGRSDAAICEGARANQCAALILKPCLPDGLATILDAALSGTLATLEPDRTGCRTLLQ
jgi:CheY-like chemotaxis protein